MTVDEASVDDLRQELATLEAEEVRISAERRQLHNQIDFGYATESTRARERKVSDERRRLPRRIDSLREILGVNLGSAEKPDAEQPIGSPAGLSDAEAYLKERERWRPREL
jgi:hypothetical protein